MDPALIFSSMNLFNLIQEYLSQLPAAVSTITQVRVAQGEHEHRVNAVTLELIFLNCFLHKITG